MGKIIQRSNHYYLKYYNPAKGYTDTEATGLKINPKNFRKAEELLRKRETAKDNGETIISSKAKKVLMSEVLELIRTDYKQNHKRDLYNMELRLKLYLLPFFRNVRAVAVTTDLIEQYKTMRLDSGCKAGTLNRELSNLSYSFKLAMKRKWISQIPLIEALKENGRRRGFFERPEFEKIYAQLPDPVKPIAELAYFTGMREGELLGLKWEQVEISRKCIRLEQTKSGIPREIHYAENPEIRSLVDLQFERKLETEKRAGKKIENLFFRYSTGKPVIDFRVAWKRACEKAGIKRLFHDLRRTAVRNLVQSGVPRETAKLISGHETDSIFERYSITNPEDTRKALGKVSVFGKSSTISSTNEGIEPNEPVQ